MTDMSPTRMTARTGARGRDDRLKSLLTYPWTWAAVGVVVATQAGMTIGSRLDWVWTAGAAVLNAVSLAGWLAITLRSNTFIAHRYARRAVASEATLLSLDELAEGLREVGADQGVQQLDLLRRKIAAVREVLDQRLSSGEITFARYAGASDEVFLNAVDNLKEVRVALTAVRSIDEGYLRRRLHELVAAGDESKSATREREALARRQALLDEQTTKVRRLLAENEHIMTTLDNAAAALADARTQGGHASMDADQAVAELVRLSQRAGRLSARAG